MNSEVCLVTGGASGLGKALVQQLRDSGRAVAVCDIDTTLGEQIAADTGARFFRLDVSDLANWHAVVGAVVDEMGAPSRVFLNAGIMTRGPQDAISDGVFDLLEKGNYRRLMAINVDGVTYGVHCLLPVMAQNGGGSITVTASLAGLSDFAYDAFYAMSKHAVVGLVRSQGPLTVNSNVRLNAFCPGAMATPMILGLTGGAGTDCMSAQEAAASLYEVSETTTSGAIWVRVSKESPLEEYVATQVEIS